MPDDDTLYFRAVGKSLEVVEKYRTDTQAAHNHWWAVARDLGATGLMASVDRLFGFVFEGDPGAAHKKTLRRVKDAGTVYWAPNKRYKAGKELAKRLEEVRCPHSGSLTRQLVGDPFAYVNMGESGPGGSIRFRMIGFHVIGDETILTVPAGGPTPPDAVRIKTSEYWALREAEEAKAAS